MNIVKTIIGSSLFLFVNPAFADTIFYTSENLGGNTWQYNYTLENTGAISLEAFSIFFDLGDYENLVVTGSPADWDSIVLQPDPGLPADGIFDSLSLGGFLNPDDILGGFSVAFDFLGSGAPGEQFYAFYDVFTFDFIVDGITQIAQVPQPMLEPGTLVLLGIGLAAMGLARRRKII